MDEDRSMAPEIEAALRHRAKVELRKRARALRNSFPRDAILERSRRIQRAIAELPAVAAARRVALFYPMDDRNEVDLRELDPVLRGRGVQVAYPAIDPESRVMTFRFVADPGAMQERGLGFREPGPADEEATSLDVIVVPALQIDPRGHRIGYGAGFYDRTLPRFCPPAHAVGVAFDFQLIAEVPATDDDVPLDTIVTDARVLAADPA
ncbi:5-formyltetrahydrofolate cyclo-ligase [Sorangium sp. So ce1036]|uniref:5-formyltetrahydrofolate cyclo-ligase n=1 Tax=Sorangium sp. So ce1036 TaxID=3133328 RepID=UPI003F068BE1